MFSNDKKDNQFSSPNSVSVRGQGSELFTSVLKGGSEPIANNNTEKTETEKTDGFFEGLAKSPYGNLEITKHLYENNLQNIFNDYQENIELLSEEKKKSVEDAYHIREMSKKYLGEYASNTGAGDVSGNLLDIYGEYQKNIKDINENFGDLELGLQREYQQQRLNIISNIMETQYNIEVSKLNEVAEQVLFDISTGNMNGVDPFTYLEEKRGDMGEPLYRSVKGALYSQTFEEVASNIQNGFYGFSIDEEGNKTRNTDPYAYIEEYKNVFSEGDSNILFGSIQDDTMAEVLQNIIQGNYDTEQFKNEFEYLESQKDNLLPNEYRDLYNKIYDTQLDRIETMLMNGVWGSKTETVTKKVPSGFDDNPLGVNYIEGLEETIERNIPIESSVEFVEQYEDILHKQDYDFLLQTARSMDEQAELNQPVEAVSIRSPLGTDGKPNPLYEQNYDPSLFADGVSKDSNVYEIEGRYYAQVSSDIDNDEIGKEEYSELSGVRGADISLDYEEKNPDKMLADGTIHYYNSHTFIRDNQKWFRLTSTFSPREISEDVMKRFKEGDLYSSNGDRRRSSDRDTLGYNGITYIEDSKNSQNFQTAKTDFQKRLVEHFEKIHPSEKDYRYIYGIEKSTAVYFEGEFWNYNVNRRFTKMKRKE